MFLGSDTASGCAVGAPAASDDGTGRTGFADAVGHGADDAVVAGECERAAPGIRITVAFAGDVRAADSGEGIAENARTRSFNILRARPARLTVREIGIGNARQRCALRAAAGRAAGSEAVR